MKSENSQVRNLRRKALRRTGMPEGEIEAILGAKVTTTSADPNNWLKEEEIVSILERYTMTKGQKGEANNLVWGGGAG